MKKLLFTCLFTSSLLFAMEHESTTLKRKHAERDTQNPEPYRKRFKDTSIQEESILLQDFGIPNEIWDKILQDVYLESSI